MKSADKHRKIILAATKVFAKKGFFNARISDIAKEAKVADGTIYLYFTNKLDILLSVFAQETEKLIDEVSTLLNAEEDVQKKLVIFISHHLQAMRKNRPLAEVIHIELRQTSKLIREYRSSSFSAYPDIIAAIIAEGQEQGIFRPEIDVELATLALFGALDESSRLWLVNGADLNHATNQLALLFQHAFSLPAASAYSA
ncbi:MAG: TetR/AcrR family transcriptional regulator [bacterium]|nr:TetR/AcrR family transcriptional regulator [bacterium]